MCWNGPVALKCCVYSAVCCMDQVYLDLCSAVCCMDQVYLDLCSAVCCNGPGVLKSCAGRAVPCVVWITKNVSKPFK